jgi:hypothetical protein
MAAVPTTIAQVAGTITALNRTVEDINARLEQQFQDEQPWPQPNWPQLPLQPQQQGNMFPVQSASGYAGRLQIFNSLIIVAGLLMSAAYQAMYSAAADQDGSAVKTPHMGFAFRMCNAVSFVTSTLCVLSCLSGMLCLSFFPACTEEPPSKACVQWLSDSKQRVTEVGDKIVSKQLYRFAIISFVTSVLSASAACVLGTLEFLGIPAISWSAFGVSALVLVLCAWVLGRYWKFQQEGVK